MILKEQLLSFFLEHPAQVFSGEDLAGRFSVTRAAIWKAIGKLKEEGYEITSQGGKGYLFSNDNDILNKETVYQAAGTSSFELIILNSVDSTNSYARKLILEGAGNGTMIIANTQTNGRGRRGNSFFSPADTGLYLSYILKPQGTIDELLKITIVTALAVHDAIKECTGIIAGIKWVNDIYIDHKKVAGILTEAISDFESGQVDSIIIGIGLNVKETVFPDELTDKAGYISPNLSRSTLAGSIYRHLGKRLTQIKEKRLLDDYRSLSILNGKRISYTKDGLDHSATVTGINSKGNLIIRTADDREEILSSGQIHIIDFD